MNEISFEARAISEENSKQQKEKATAKFFFSHRKHSHKTFELT